MNFRSWTWGYAAALTTGGCSDDGGRVDATSGTGTISSSGVDTGTTETTAVPTTGPTTTVGTSGSTEAVSGSGTTTGLMSSSGDTSSGSGTTEGEPCGGCPVGFFCKYEQCLPDLGPCATNDDCPGDSYCDVDGVCIPYGVPPDIINDPECKKEPAPEGVAPELQCEWRAPTDPADKTKGSTWVYTTPIVADLNLDMDPGKLQPSASW